MESLLFQHYLTTQTLLSFEDAAAELRKLCATAPSSKSTVSNEVKKDEEVKNEEIKVEHDADVDMDRPLETEDMPIKKEAEEEVDNTTQPPTISLTPSDYLLGVFDMTGELMRFAITSIATSGSLPSSTSTSTTSSAPRTPLHDLQHLRQNLSTLDYGSASSPFAREAEKKLEVTVQSVEKVERAMYGLVVRGSERPKGWVPALEEEAGREVEVY